MHPSAWRPLPLASALALSRPREDTISLTQRGVYRYTSIVMTPCGGDVPVAVCLWLHFFAAAVLSAVRPGYATVCTVCILKYVHFHIWCDSSVRANHRHFSLHTSLRSSHFIGAGFRRFLTEGSSIGWTWYFTTKIFPPMYGRFVPYSRTEELCGPMFSVSIFIASQPPKNRFLG